MAMTDGKPRPKDGDINHDGCVNEEDLDILMLAFGTQRGDSGFNEHADLNKDGLVNIQDYEIMREHWGEGCAVMPGRNMAMGTGPTPGWGDGDLNGDGCVNEKDLAILIRAFGTSDKTADLNGDGVVNIQDYNIMRNHWGEGCGPGTE